MEALMTGILVFSMVPAIVVFIALYSMFVKTALINTYPMLIVVYTAIICGQTILFLRNFIENIPVEIEEAAAIDGCSRMQILMAHRDPADPPRHRCYRDLHLRLRLERLPRRHRPCHDGGHEDRPERHRPLHHDGLRQLLGTVLRLRRRRFHAGSDHLRRLPTLVHRGPDLRGRQGVTGTPQPRVAVIGAAGWAGSRHAEAFHELGADVVALIDPSPRVRELAHTVGAAVLSSYADLSPDAVDLVVVSLPSSAQPEVTAELLRRGFRVLVEKPIGSSSDNAAILADVDGIDESLMVGYTLHQHPAAKELAEWVASSTVVSVSIRSAARKLSLHLAAGLGNKGPNRLAKAKRE